MESRTPEPSYRSAIYDTYTKTTYAHRATLTGEGVRRNAATHLRLVGEFLPRDKDEKILEIGCGNGGFLLCCEQQGYRNVEGVDISPQQVEFCHRLGFANVVCIDGFELLRENAETYGLIVMNDVLEHLPKSRVLPMLQLVLSRLRAGGRLILRVPNMSNPLNVRTRYVDFTHEVGFSAETLQQVLRVAGFDVEVVKGAYDQDRRWLFRMVFDVLLLWIFRQIHKRTLHLQAEVVPGKNLLAVGRKS